MKLQKLAGYACIILILSNIASTSLLIGLFRDFTELDIYDPAKMMAAYDSSTASFLIYYVLGIISAVFTLLIVVALAERMRAGAPQLMRLAVIGASAYFALYTTTMIGGFFRNILLAQTNDLSAFRTFLVLHEFLGYAASSLLGWGLLCVACAALATRSLPRVLSCIMLIFSILSSSL